MINNAEETHEVTYTTALKECLCLDENNINSICREIF
jgi:hypothetical protein